MSRATYHSIPLVAIDTREQKPYEFPDWPCIHKALPSGDYSLVGHETSFAIERKSLADLVGCIFQDRFKRELERLQGYQRAFLAIEGDLWQIENSLRRICPKSKVNPKAVLGFLQSIPLTYGVHVLFLKDRLHAQAYVAGLLEKYNRYSLKEKGDSNAV
jgi:DNA excision repair protein ERCC-4